MKKIFAAAAVALALTASAGAAFEKTTPIRRSCLPTFRSRNGMPPRWQVRMSLA